MVGFWDKDENLATCGEKIDLDFHLVYFIFVLLSQLLTIIGRNRIVNLKEEAEKGRFLFLELPCLLFLELGIRMN